MTAHRTRTTLLWIALSIAGVVIAVAGSYAASQLSKPKVGLTSEPLSGVEQLAPAQRAKPRPQKPERTATDTTPSTTPQLPQTTQTQTTPPSQNEGDGERGGDGAGNDD